MKLQFHQASLDLIKSDAFMTDPPALLAKYPPSVREWYSLANGVSLLTQYSNQDVPLPPEKFVPHEYKDKELIEFMYENQGVVWWAFEFNELDDPPVYINLDPPPDNWVLCCDRFSTFIYTRLFDFYHWLDQNNIVMGSGRPVGASMEKNLQNEFSLEPVTYGWPGARQIRFSQGGIKITIHDDSQQSISNWYFSADSPEALRNIFNHFKHLFEWYHPHDLAD